MQKISRIEIYSKSYFIPLYKVGDQVWLVPGHCDPTVNMYDEIIGVRNGLVESVWPITGRGPGV